MHVFHTLEIIVYVQFCILLFRLIVKRDFIPTATTVLRLTDIGLSGSDRSTSQGELASVSVVMRRTAIKAFRCQRSRLSEHFLGLESQKWDSRARG